MGWHILFYNLRRNIEFDGVVYKENSSFFCAILEFKLLRTEPAREKL